MKEKYTKKDFLELFDRCRKLRRLQSKLKRYMRPEKLPVNLPKSIKEEFDKLDNL